MNATLPCPYLEKRYGAAYQVLVRMGARPQLRLKYRG